VGWDEACRHAANITIASRLRHRAY